MAVQQLRRAWGMAAWTANVELLLARRARLEAGPSPRGYANGRHGNAARGGGAAGGAAREFRRAEAAAGRERTARGSAARTGGGGDF